MAATNGEQRGGQNADLDFAADMFKAADKPRQNVEPSEYKHTCPGGLILPLLSIVLVEAPAILT